MMFRHILRDMMERRETMSIWVVLIKMIRPLTLKATEKDNNPRQHRHIKGKHSNIFRKSSKQPQSIHLCNWSQIHTNQVEVSKMDSELYYDILWYYHNDKNNDGNLFITSFLGNCMAVTAWHRNHSVTNKKC